MTIIPFPGKRDLYPDLKNRHIEACLDDVAALFRIAAQDLHEKKDEGPAFHIAFAAALAEMRGLHRDVMPGLPVPAGELMIAAFGHDAETIEALIRNSRNSPPLTGNEWNARDLIERYVVEDTRAAVDLALNGFLCYERNMQRVAAAAAEHRYGDMRDLFREVLETVYDCPAGNSLQASVTEKLARLGLALPAPPNGRDASYTPWTPG